MPKLSMRIKIATKSHRNVATDAHWSMSAIGQKQTLFIPLVLLILRDKVAKNTYFNGGGIMNLSSNFPKKAVVLIVDDALDNLTLMDNLLKDIYTVRAANNGENHDAEHVGA